MSRVYTLASTSFKQSSKRLAMIALRLESFEVIYYFAAEDCCAECTFISVIFLILNIKC